MDVFTVYFGSIFIINSAKYFTVCILLLIVAVILSLLCSWQRKITLELTQNDITVSVLLVLVVSLTA